MPPALQAALSRPLDPSAYDKVRLVASLMHQELTAVQGVVHSLEVSRLAKVRSAAHIRSLVRVLGEFSEYAKRFQADLAATGVGRMALPDATVFRGVAGLTRIALAASQARVADVDRPDDISFVGALPSGPNTALARLLGQVGSDLEEMYFDAWEALESDRLDAMAQASVTLRRLWNALFTEAMHVPELHRRVSRAGESTQKGKVRAMLEPELGGPGEAVEADLEHIRRVIAELQGQPHEQEGSGKPFTPVPWLRRLLRVRRFEYLLELVANLVLKYRDLP